MVNEFPSHFHSPFRRLPLKRPWLRSLFSVFGVQKITNREATYILSAKVYQWKLYSHEGGKWHNFCKRLVTDNLWLPNRPSPTLFSRKPHIFHKANEMWTNNTLKKISVAHLLNTYSRIQTRLAYLWCCHRPTVAMEMLVLMLMLMLVKMLVMVLMRLVMHELRRAHPGGNPVRCLRLQETVVKFVTEKFRTCKEIVNFSRYIRCTQRINRKVPCEAPIGCLAFWCLMLVPSYYFYFIVINIIIILLLLLLWKMRNGVI